MNQIFTEYLRSLDPAGQPPDRESFGRVWRELRRLLEREIRRRGLWNSPPSYLGIYGREAWTEAEAAAEPGPSFVPGAHGDGLEELEAACYAYVFVHRQKNLLDHLIVKPTIDGLVVLNVRHFLHETQKRHDPLGFRIFKILRSAVQQGIDAEELFVLKGGPEIRNDTVLGFRPETDSGELSSAELEGVVRRWNDVLLPELVEARGKKREWVVRSLRTFLSRLPAEGVAGFAFRELIEPLKNDVRARRADQLELSQGQTGVESIGEDDLAKVVPLVDPDTRIEDAESFEKLRECVDESLSGLAAPAKTREDLRTLWERLNGAAERGESPSQRKLAGELNLSRKRLSTLLNRLGELIEACRRSQSEEGDVIPWSGTEKITGDAMKPDASRAEALRFETGEVRRRYADARSQLDRRQRPAPRRGDVFLLAATGKLPVEWAVLADSGSGRLLAVPADLNPVAGSSDVAVREEISCGPLVLRCAFGVWLDVESFDSRMRTGTLSAQIRERARRRCEEVLAAASPLAVDGDPDYLEWATEILEPAREAVRERSGDIRREPAGVLLPFLKRWSSPRNPLALAASILLAAGLGLGAGIVSQRQRIAEPTQVEPVGKSNIHFRQLRFSAEGTRSRPVSVVLPANADELFLVLNVMELSEELYETFLLEILQEETKDEVWLSEELTKVDRNRLTVSVPTRLLPTGDYLFRLYGLPGSLDEALADYALGIEYE